MLLILYFIWGFNYKESEVVKITSNGTGHCPVNRCHLVILALEIPVLIINHTHKPCR